VEGKFGPYPIDQIVPEIGRKFLLPMGKL